MFSQDYIIRQIRHATAALATILGLAKTGQFQAALQAIDQTLEELVGLSPSLVKGMDDQSLLNLLTTHAGPSSERLVVVAELFKAEGDILLAQKCGPQSVASYARALTLHLAATQSDLAVPSAELVAKIGTLQQKGLEGRLPAETLLQLQSFYTRLLELHDAGVLNPGMARPEIEKHLHAIEQHLLEIS